MVYMLIAGSIKVPQVGACMCIHIHAPTYLYTYTIFATRQFCLSYESKLLPLTIYFVPHDEISSSCGAILSYKPLLQICKVGQLFVNKFTTCAVFL